MIVKVKLTYFKPSGKYYTDGEFEMEVEDCSKSGGDAGKNIPYLYDILAKVRDMNRCGPVPGLSTNWDGPILVNTEPSCCPALLL